MYFFYRYVPGIVDVIHQNAVKNTTGYDWVAKDRVFNILFNSSHVVFFVNSNFVNDVNDLETYHF